MIFNPNATVISAMLHKSFCKKAKPQPVAAREFCSLSYRLSGKVRLLTDTDELLSYENCVTFMPAGVPYVTEVMDDSEMIVVHFYTLQKYKNLRPMIIDVTDCIDIKNIFFEMESAYVIGGDTEYLQLSKCYELLAALDNYERTLVPRRMRLAKNFIDKNYNDTLSVSALAYASGLSEVYFRSEFKKYFGVSPVSYIKRLRIDNAKQMLLSGCHSVSEVATTCGFESISYFSYEFRRITGITPSDYIKKYSI